MMGNQKLEAEMYPKILKTQQDYEVALAHLESLMNAKPGTPEGEELELWMLIIGDYEERHYPIEPPDPISAIKFHMDQQGLRQADLIPMIGGKSRVSEVLSGKRPLTLAMIRKLHEGLGIPLDILVQLPSTGNRPAKARKALDTQHPGT